ncbi:hypothetical protein [Pyxidicoccus caerfyrddinensis]|uniref:hypothetical protein n=1 Tax=Pyxidicoccus caerfyrddinensis TaxID=2709663 RepID=UPI0013DAED03|nr:hypothetical protein [Pyxidicoccus caerfyrddinensis]
MRTAIVAKLMAVGLLTSCGGFESTMDEEDALGTREDAVESCSGTAYDRTFYAEPAMVTIVGSWSCRCRGNYYDVPIERMGRMSTYFRDINVQVCEGVVP